MAGEKTYIADKETLDKIYNILAVDPIYGFIEHMNILSPTQRIEYIGLNKNFTPVSRNTNGSISLNDWAGFEILEANKPYMVRSDGTPDYRLQDNDYTKKYSDGSASDVANTSYDGGAFSWLQKIYKNETVVGDDRIVKFSLTKREGYEPVGFIDPDNKELEGVWLPMFYGSIVEDKMRSLSGLQPDYNKTTAAQKTAIDAVGNRAKFLGGAIVETIADLLLMFGKNSNIQDVFGYGNCSGYDQSLTPTMGVKQNAVVGGGQFYATTDQKSLNKIFHSIVLGSYGSGVSIAAAPTFQSASIPAIGCSCTNPAVTEANPYYFRVCFLDPFQGSVMANFAKDEFSAANAYVLSMLGEDYGSGLATYFVNAFEDLGGTVTSEQFPEGTSDFSAYIQNAINAGADVIFAPCATTYAAQIITQAALFWMPRRAPACRCIAPPSLTRTMIPAQPRSSSPALRSG